MKIGNVLGEKIQYGLEFMKLVENMGIFHLNEVNLLELTLGFENSRTSWKDDGVNIIRKIHD